MVIAIKSHIDFQNIKILFFFFFNFFPSNIGSHAHACFRTC